MHNRILTVLLTLVLMIGCTVNASAATMPDLSQEGSLTFTMKVDGEDLDDGKLNLYYLATEEKVSISQYDFRLLDELSAEGATLDTEALYDSVQAQELLTLAKNVLDQYITIPIEDGKARADDLKTGLYLVWQRQSDASRGYDAILPFLISVPKMQNGNYVLDVEAIPKVPFETTPTEPTTPPPPPPPNLPQTGQLNWPIPLLAISGAALVIAGWILCVSKRKCDHEK